MNMTSVRRIAVLHAYKEYQRNRRSSVLALRIGCTERTLLINKAILIIDIYNNQKFIWWVNILIWKSSNKAKCVSNFAFVKRLVLLLTILIKPNIANGLVKQHVYLNELMDIYNFKADEEQRYLRTYIFSLLTIHWTEKRTTNCADLFLLLINGTNIYFC